MTYYNCDGNCLIDTDGDGVCDELEVYGCTNPEVFNFDSNATEDDGSCYFSPFGPDPDTDCNAILVPADAAIHVDEILSIGNWLGVFYTDSDGNLAYGGGVQWNGETLLLLHGELKLVKIMDSNQVKYLHCLWCKYKWNDWNGFCWIFIWWWYLFL